MKLQCYQKSQIFAKSLIDNFCIFTSTTGMCMVPQNEFGHAQETYQWYENGVLNGHSDGRSEGAQRRCYDRVCNGRSEEAERCNINALPHIHVWTTLATVLRMCNGFGCVRSPPFEPDTKVLHLQRGTVHALRLILRGK